MTVLGIIPARYQSTRFPGKPLAQLAGKSMIQRVYEQVQKAKSISRVAVATDDERIAAHVTSFGGLAVMTSPEHPSGTDRCQETLQKLAGIEDVVINIQGDEPLIHPEQIDAVAKLFSDPSTDIGTLARPISEPELLLNPNVVKLILQQSDFAIYFSRAAIPFQRGVAVEEWINHHTYLQHIGIYGYRSTVLQAITDLQPSNLEKRESLEQLRWLENGYRIKVGLTDQPSQGVDTPEDLKRVEAIIASASH